MTWNGLLPKIIWKKGIPIPSGYILVKVWYNKIMECDFKTELENELRHLEYFFNFMYFNDALVDDEKCELEKLIRSHRDVISFLGGRNDKVSKDVLRH